MAEINKKDIKEETKTYARLTFEEVMGQLGQLLGTTEPEKIKIMSNIPEGKKEEHLYSLDIYRTYKYDFILTYVFDDIKMAISEDSRGRTGIEQTLQKAVSGQQESNSEKSRLQKLRELFQ